jgi:hypothetical protein
MLPIAALSVLLCLSITTVNSIACPNLKAAAKYAVVAGTTVTNTGNSVITGNLAIFPGTSLTGFPPGVITGSTQVGTPAANQSQIDETAAYTYCKGLPYDTSLTYMDLAGKTLAPGVYNFASSVEITAGGTLTLNGKGIYIFQVGSMITTGAGAQIMVEGGASAGCIFWQVGSSATLGASSTFLGNILAYASVTFDSDVTYQGSVYAQTGAVTLINDTITHPSCCNAC